MLKLKQLKNLKSYKAHFKNTIESKPQTILGVCLSKNSATVLCLNVEGKNKKILGSFSITADQQPEQNLQNLVSLIAQGCTQRNWQFSDVALTLDSVLYMQHAVHSEFNDARQIAATVRFDTEEALSMDITDLAIAFKVLDAAKDGAALAVFTARKKLLSDIILALEANGLDPAVCEPDIVSLARFIPVTTSVPDDANTLYCLFAAQNAYVVDFAKLQQPILMRTSIVGESQARTELLKREIPVTSGLIGYQGPINAVRLYDPAAQFDYPQLTSALGIDTDLFDLDTAACVPQDCSDHLAFALAFGAALSLVQREQQANFRSDFMPYQGKKVALEKTIKILSISFIILMFAIGIYFQMQLFQKNKYRSQLRKKFETEFATVMFGKTPPKTDPVKKLAGELRRIKDAKSGLFSLTNQQTPAAKLTLVFEAFNKCAAQVHLNIDSVTISSSTINITGDTSSRENTLKLFETLRQNKLDILQQRLDSKGGKDSFSISVVPKQ